MLIILLTGIFAILGSAIGFAWCGILAAINWRRLGFPVRAVWPWMLAAIGAGICLGCARGLWGFGTLEISMAWLSGVWAGIFLIGLGIAPQLGHFDRHCSAGGERARPWIPLIGALAILVLNLSHIGHLTNHDNSFPAEAAAVAYFNRGVTRGNQGDIDRSITDFSKAIRLNPRYFEAYFNRGVGYGKNGNTDAAIADFTKAIGMNPGHAEAYYNRGVAYRTKGETDKAIADYGEAIRHNPQYFDAYYNRGRSTRSNTFCGNTTWSKSARPRDSTRSRARSG